MTDNLPALLPSITGSMTVVETSDAACVDAWVRQSESSNTQRAYRRHAAQFLAFVGKPLAHVIMSDVLAYRNSLTGSSATRAIGLNAVKSLLTFCQETGYIAFNAGKAVKAPSVKNTLAERIMTESDAMHLVRQGKSARDRAILTLAYGGGLRISELAGLRWRDLAARDTAGQATIYGKGGKTRVVLLSANTWTVLQGIRDEASADDAVFRSRKGGTAMDVSAIHRVVKDAAARAGLSAAVSAHWLRHAHASHSLDRGAPIHLVSATLGHASVATTGRYAHARPSDSSARYLGV